MAMSWELTRSSTGEPAGEMYAVTEHWYLTEDKTRVVEEGHPDSRWLWASPGTQVPRRDAIRLGALKEEPTPEPAPVQEGAVAEDPEADRAAEPEAEPPAEEKKAAKQAPNKAAKKATNKAADKAEDK